MGTRANPIDPGRLMLVLVAGLCALAAMAGGASARVSAIGAGVTRYVATDGDDLQGANTCTSAAAPCATLGQALSVALNDDRVELAAGTFDEPGLVIDRNIALHGAGPAETILTSNGDGSVLTVDAFRTVEIERLALIGGEATAGAGLRLEAGAHAVVRDALISENSALLGGGVFVTDGSLQLTDSLITNNWAQNGGGGYVENGRLDLLDTTLTGNGGVNGGGLAGGRASTININRGRLTANWADTSGGAIVSRDGNVNLLNVILDGNRAENYGGGLFADGAIVRATHVTWIGNRAVAGGAITGNGDVIVRNSIIAASQGENCSDPVSGEMNLVDDVSCGLPLMEPAGVAPDGSLALNANAIDMIEQEFCVARSQGDNPLFTDGQPVSQDQRGSERPVATLPGRGPLCDVGAIEYLSRLTIAVQPEIADGSRFRFTGDLGNFILSAPDSAWMSFPVPGGRYQIDMRLLSGWKVDAITCEGDLDGGSGGDPPSRTLIVDLDPDEALVCTFLTRPNPSSIGISLFADPPIDIDVPFQGDLGAFVLRDPSLPDTRYSKLDPRSYAVQALPPAGWSVAAIDCQGDTDQQGSVSPETGTAHIDLDNGEKISCAFHVKQTIVAGSILLRQVSNPETGEPFTYTGDLGAFSLRGPDLTEKRFAGLQPGRYRIHELLHPVRTLQSIDCDGDRDSGSVIDIAGGLAAIDLDAGEHITCTFVHTQPITTGKIVIVQRTDTLHAIPFGFSGDLGEFALLPPDAGKYVANRLAPGNYSVKQTTANGWPLESISCRGDLDGGSNLYPEQALANLELDAGETIRCSFTNNQPPGTVAAGDVSIRLESQPPDDTIFSFGGDFGSFELRDPSDSELQLTELLPRSYAIAVQAPNEWEITGIACTGDLDEGNQVDTASGSLVIDLDDGEEIACAFTASKMEIPPPDLSTILLPVLIR